MGQEISKTKFSQKDFDSFKKNLTTDTQQLQEQLSQHPPQNESWRAGFELEACLVDTDQLRPAPVNEAFLENFTEQLVTPELATFNVEFNTPVFHLTKDFLRQTEISLKQTISSAQKVSADLGIEIMYCGILPTLRDEDLTEKNMSKVKRYRALNEQVLARRFGKPLKLDINGRQHIASTHYNVMLEAATTSFQLHLQTPYKDFVNHYNASILISAPLLAASSNSPFLFGKDVWEETRIPLFEQSVDLGGYDGAAMGPLHRVTFGSGYLRQSVMEAFIENMEHYPPLLPVIEDNSQPFPYLRMHNGTLWRWNRPLVGFNGHDDLHIRMEHRSLPGGPSIPDMVANAALFYGLTQIYADADCQKLEFAMARDNFYQAARFGLSAKLLWLDGQRISAKDLLLNQLIPEARRGLEILNVDTGDIDHYLGIIEERVLSSQTGSEWQRQKLKQTDGDFSRLTRAYINEQNSGQPVHLWAL